MKVFFFGTEQKLPLVTQPNFSDYQDHWDDPWFWVVHPGSDLTSFLDEKKRNISECVRRGGAILFISGSARCGLESNETAEKLEAEQNGRIHFLRSSCGDSLPGSPPSRVAERILHFIKLVEDLEAYEAVPWSEVEAGKWPENLLAVYLVMKALETCPEDAPAIRNAWDLMDSAWKRRVWANAWKEYHEDLKLRGTTWTGAGLPSLDGDLSMPDSPNLVAAVATIRRAFGG